MYKLSNTTYYGLTMKMEIKNTIILFNITNNVVMVGSMFRKYYHTSGEGIIN